MPKQKMIRWICYAVALIGFIIVIVSLFGPADISAADSKELSSAVGTDKILSPASMAS
jgi:hypothetical protein